MNVIIHKTKNGYYCAINGNTAFSQIYVFNDFAELCDWLDEILNKEEKEKSK